MQENRMYAQMLKAARRWLADRQPEEVAAKAKVAFDRSTQGTAIPGSKDYAAGGKCG